MPKNSDSDKGVIILFWGIAVVVIIAWAIGWTCSEPKAQVTWESHPVNSKPDMKGFTPEQLKVLRDWSTRLLMEINQSQHQQDETIRYLRDSVDDIPPGGSSGDTCGCCDTMITSYLEQCTYEASEQNDGSSDKIIANTYAWQLQYYNPAYSPARDTSFSWSPVLRMMTPNGDSVEMTPPYSIENTNRVRYILPLTTKGTRSGVGRIWLWHGGNFTDGDPDNSAGDGVQYEGSLFPHAGLTQSGRQAVNTSMDRDTIKFASILTDTSGGGYNAVLTVTSKSSCGFRYDLGVNGTVDDYVALVQWGPHDGSYAGDSLWVVSKTDSSFIVGIKYSASARTMTFITHGYREKEE